MPERLSLEEAKNFWFSGNFTVCTLSIYDDEVWALPEIEVERGQLYVNRLEFCSTFGEAQELYEFWINDANAPKFLPKELIDLKSIVEKPWESLKDSPFSFTESPFYRDDYDVLVTIGRPQLWTDSWIPKEIAEIIGVPDEGYGIDYIPAELIYPKKQEFKEAFEKIGFKVIENDARLRVLAGY